MKLLFDENLSLKLPRLLEDLFPGSSHVQDCGLQGQSDRAIWDYAAANGFTIVSKDSDFYRLSILAEPPPKVIWLCVGNCTRQSLLELLRRNRDAIDALEYDAESLLILS